MKTLLTLCLIVLLQTMVIGQDWTGFYSLHIDKNGYQATLKVQLYQVNGDYWGEIRGSGNSAFGDRWSIEFWTDKTDEAINCYYDKGGAGLKLVNNEFLFSFTGTKNKFFTSFGEGLTKNVKHLETHAGFALDENEGKIEAFSSVTAASPAKSTPTTPAVPTAAKSTGMSKSEMLVGKWKGEVATETTQFFDYEFMADGTAKRGQTSFQWALKTDETGDFLELATYKSITGAQYFKYLEEADGDVMLQDSDYVIKTKDGKTHIIKISVNNY
jgi:hypothetical protein